MDLDVLLVDQTHRVHGRGATYVAPGGSETPDITVVFHEPPGDSGIDGVDLARGVAISSRKADLLVRVSQVEAPLQGGAFVLDRGVVWAIGEDPIIHESSTDLEWRCSCVREI